MIRLAAAAACLVALAGCTSAPAAKPAAPGPHPALVGTACRAGVRYGETLPDRRCTPGAVNPAVTRAMLCPTVSRSVVRAVSARTKRQVRDAYGEQRPGEIDHLISLELGGSNAPTNLWPEPGKVPNDKDLLEGRLHTLVCSGSITLAEAQQAISTDWITAYERFVGPLP